MSRGRPIRRPFANIRHAESVATFNGPAAGRYVCLWPIASAHPNAINSGAIGGIADMPRSPVTHPADANDPTPTLLLRDDQAVPLFERCLSAVAWAFARTT
jgi:hypothetical protein